MSFDNIIGNENVKTLLTKSINTNNILHSYLFIGIKGIGKSLFAKEFSEMLLGYNINNNPDFMIIEAEDAKSIKIEQIRLLQEKVAEKPVKSSRKVYIINDCDLMTKEAQNCLLKTLEEPPEYAVIILIASNESKLLNTIKSRCTKIVFKPLDNNCIKKYFDINHINCNLTDNTFKLCNGSIGKAIELQNEINTYTLVDDIINSFQEKDIVDIWNNSNILYQSKDNIIHILEYMNIVFMDKLLSSNDLRYIQCVKIIEQAKSNLSYNANFDMCIDNLLLKIWEEFNEKYNWS